MEVLLVVPQDCHPFDETACVDLSSMRIGYLDVCYEPHTDLDLIPCKWECLMNSWPPGGAGHKFQGPKAGRSPPGLSPG